MDLHCILLTTEFEILVKRLPSDYFRIRTCMNERVAGVSAKIQAKESQVTPAEQHLTLNGRTLEDESRLVEYDGSARRCLVQLSMRSQ
jgi:hypothetical protein